MNSSKNCSEGCHTAFGKCIRMPEKICLVFLALCVLSSCGPSAEEKAKMEFLAESMILADSIVAYAPGLATDKIDGITHNFIRTADLKFKVENVVKSSDWIQRIVTKRHGYITSSSLSSEISYSTSVKFNEDSLLESVCYITTNTVSLRITNGQLDSLLDDIGKLSVFLNYRNLKSEDAKIQVYAQSLSEKRDKKYTETLKKETTKHTAPLDQKITLQDKLLEKQENADNSRLDTYYLSDKINYSTVVLDLYQKEQLVSEVVPAFPVTEPFTPSFPSELKNSFVGGFNFLKGFLLLITRCWLLLLLLLIIALILKKTKTSFKKNYSSGLE